MTAQLISNTKQGIVYAGSAKETFILPEPHRAIVLFPTYVGDHWTSSEFLQILETWSRDLKVMATLEDYANDLAATLFDDRNRPSSLSDSIQVLYAFCNFFKQSRFRKKSDEDFVLTWEVMEQHSELVDIEYQAIHDIVDVSLARQELESMAKQSAPYKFPDEECLREAIANTNFDDDNRQTQELGAELLELGQEYGVLILRDYLTRFELVKQFTIAGFGGAPYPSGALLAQVGGKFGSEVAIKCQDILKGQTVVDATGWFLEEGSQMEIGIPLIAELGNRVKFRPWEVARKCKDLVVLLNSMRGFFTGFYSSDDVITVEISRETVVKS